MDCGGSNHLRAGRLILEETWLVSRRKAMLEHVFGKL